MTKNICFVLILILLTGCNSFLVSSSPSSLREGKISLYLSFAGLSPPDISFTLIKIEVEKDNRIWFPLFEGEKKIHSLALAGKQIFLAESLIPAGRYERMKVTVREASLVRGEKKFTLALPSPGEEATSPVEFQIFKNESTSLFLSWDVEGSIKDKYLFRPALTLKPQKMEIRKLLLFVTNTGSDSVTVINRQSDQVVAVIGTGRRPMGIVTSPRGGMVYVANSDSNSISIIDASHNRVIDTIALSFGISPRELAVSPDGRKLYVSNFHSNNVSIFDIAGRNLTGRVTVGSNPMGIATNERGDRVYVVNSTSNNFSVIDPWGEIINNVGVGSNPTDIKFYRDKIFVVNAGSGIIYQINARSLRVEKEMTGGYGPHKLVGGFKNRIYVANRNSNDISVIPFSMNMAIKSIAVEDLPQGMAIDRERSKLYVANGGADTVSVIDLVREKLISGIPVGKRPYGVALIE